MPELVVDSEEFKRRQAEKRLGANNLFDPIPFGELVGLEPPRRDWVIQDWLPRGTVTALYGQGGVGKSLLAQQLATAVAGGKQWLGAAGAQGLVMGLFCEDDRNELWRRQLALCRHYDTDLDRLLSFLELDARMGKENVLASEYQRAIAFTPFMEHIEQLAVERMPLVLIVDNIAQVFAGNENDRAMATQFVNRLARIAINAKCAVLLLGHPSKLTGSEYSGSTGWDAAVRSRWLLERITEKVDGKEQPTGQLMLRRLKANYAQQDNLVLEWEAGAYARVEGGGIVDNVRRRKRDEDADAAVLTGIPALTALGVRATPHKTGPYYLPKLLDAHHLAGGCGRRSLEHALERLLASGRVRTEERRNEKTRRKDEWLVVVPEG